MEVRPTNSWGAYSRKRTIAEVTKGHKKLNKSRHKSIEPMSFQNFIILYFTTWQCFAVSLACVSSPYHRPWTSGGLS